MKKILIAVILTFLIFTILTLIIRVNANSSTWYFRNTNASTGPTSKASTDTDSFPSVPADKNTPKDMSATKGTAQTSVGGAYIANNLKTMARIFVGPALATQTLTGGQTGYKVAVGIRESSTSMNLYMRTFVYVWRSGSGNVKTIIVPTSCTVEHGTSERGCVITATGAAGDFSILLGDRIVVEIWFDIRDLTTSYTATLYYDGATDPTENTLTSNAASYFYSPQTLNLPNNTPSNGTPSGTNWDDTDNCYAQRQWYQAVVVYTDLDGYADFDYVELYLQTGGAVVRAQFRYDEDTNAATTELGGIAWELDTTAGNFVESGTTITVTWKFKPKWGATEESDLDFKLYCCDDEPSSDTDTIDVNFDVITNLLVSTIECTNTNTPDRININTATQIDVTVLYANDPSSSTPTTFYPPDAEFTSISIHDSSHSVKGTDGTIVNGVGNVAITSETTVQSMNYHAYISMADADYVAGDESPTETIISDRLEFVSITADDTRINIGANFELRYQIRYDFDDVTFDNTKGSITGFTWDVANSWWDRTVTGSSSVTSTNYDETYVSITDSTYGLTVKQDVAGISVITDRIRIDSLGLTDTRINANGVETSTLYATASLEYDSHTLGSGDSLTISGLALSWVAGNSRFEGTTASSSSVTSITYNAFTSGNEATYVITAGNINSKTATLIYDKLQVQSYTVSDSRDNINDDVTIDALIWFDYDNTVCTTGTITINGYSAIHQGNGVYRITRTSATVTSVTYNIVACSAESTYGITTVDQNSQSVSVIWDRIRIDSLSSLDGRIDVSTQGTYYSTASLEYDNHALGSGDSLTLGGYAFSWVAGNSRFEYLTTQSSVTAITINSFTSGNEATYGITVGNINSKTATIIWDRIRIDTLNAVSSYIPMNTEGEWYATASLEYDNHALGSGDSLTLSGYLFTWDATDNRFEHKRTETWPIIITINAFTSGNEATFSITVGNINGQSQSIEWYAVGYNLDLHVMDWDLTDAISGATVYKDADTLTSNANGWANWTLVSGTVQIKVKYFGFWVNGTFSVTMDSDKTIDVRCRLYDVTITVQESIQSAYLVNANVTVFNSTSTYGNRIKTGITGNKGQVALTNLPNNTLTFTQYGKSDWSLVIGNTTQLVNTENQSITLTPNQNNLSTQDYRGLIGIVGFVIPLKRYSIKKCLKRKKEIDRGEKNGRNRFKKEENTYW